MDKRLEATGRLLEVMDELRVKCPWDREQTFLSLKNNTIEETYELVDAIMDGDRETIKKELGDLLLHVVFYSKIGSEEGAFDLGDVANSITDKLIYRHPHVFAGVDVSGSEQVSQNWEDLKLREKKADTEKKGVLGGVPRSLPAMVKAYRISQKAASAGFDWNQKEDVWEKVKEEVAELQAEFQTGDTRKREEELGDLLFSLVNVARLYGIDPEGALERTNRKFISRFNRIEKYTEEQNLTLRSMSPDQMEELWQKAKNEEKAQ